MAKIRASDICDLCEKELRELELSYEPTTGRRDGENDVASGAEGAPDESDQLASRLRVEPDPQAATPSLPPAVPSVGELLNELLACQAAFEVTNDPVRANKEYQAARAALLAAVVPVEESERRVREAQKQGYDEGYSDGYDAGYGEAEDNNP